ncbi:hypothetical protein Btru_033222 [Bulinus truncatus]|nr:hypothetical protein Btru_033222 [Bulinus truncatus]
MATANTAGSADIELTVTKRWKVENLYFQELTTVSPPSRGPTVARWFLSVALLFALTCSLVLTKTSFISLCTHVQNTSWSPEQYDVHFMSYYIVLYSAVTASCCLQLFRSVWHVLSFKSEKWPSLKSSCLAVGCDALQAAGEALLALKVVPLLGPTLTTFTMALSLVIPVVWETAMSWKPQYSARLKICYTCACLCLLTGLGIFIYLVYDHYHQHSFQVSHAVHLAVCLVIMNLAWLPWLLKATSNGGSIETGR